MSDTEQEGMSERELAEWFSDEQILGDAPRSVGEALDTADEEAQAGGSAEVPGDEVVDEQSPVVVVDEPVQPEVEAPEAEPEPTGPDEPVEPEEEEVEEGEDDNVVWAKKKYGDDPTKWAAAARAQEQHISRLAGEKKEAEELAGQWYEYAQSVEQQAAQQQQGMPLSSAEEQWIENSLANPYQAALQAAHQGNFNLYQGVIARVAEENPLMAAQIGAQVQREMEQLVAVESNGPPQPTLAESLGQSIQRLGIDLDTYGAPMSQKIGELGEHHPYVQTILEGEPGARDIALMAVYDLVRSTAMSTRKVRSDEREAQIKHEAELRRQAAGVVTGGPEVAPKEEKSPFFGAMEEEWKARGQWAEEE